MANERILLVEGEDDEHVVRHLYRKACDIEPNFRIVNQRGYEKLLEALGVYLKKSGLQTLGVVVDADDREARWQELAASAKKCAVSLPDVPDVVAVRCGVARPAAGQDDSARTRSPRPRSSTRDRLVNPARLRASVRRRRTDAHVRASRDPQAGLKRPIT